MFREVKPLAQSHIGDQKQSWDFNSQAGSNAVGVSRGDREKDPGTGLPSLLSHFWLHPLKHTPNPPAMPSRVLFLKQPKCFQASGLLHMLFPLPGVPFPP